jgi:hypothetical protein
MNIERIKSALATGGEHLGDLVALTAPGEGRSAHCLRSLSDAGTAYRDFEFPQDFLMLFERNRFLTVNPLRATSSLPL